MQALKYSEKHLSLLDWRLGDPGPLITSAPASTSASNKGQQAPMLQDSYSAALVPLALLKLGADLSETLVQLLSRVDKGRDLDPAWPTGLD